MRIAIVKLSSLGDIAHAAIVVQLIKNHIKNAFISWIVDARFACLVKLCKGVDEVVSVYLKDKEYKKSYQILKSIGEFDAVIDMQGLIKSALVARLLGRCSGFGYNGVKEGLASLFYAKKFDMDYGANIIRRNAFLVGFVLDFNVKEDEILHKKPCFIAKKQERSEQKRILIAPFASENSKCYDKFKALILLLQSGDIQIFISHANDDELARAKDIAFQTMAKILERKNMVDMVDFISNCDLVIGNDSGISHIAWAQNIPSITLFGNRPASRNSYETAINKSLSGATKQIDARKIDKKDLSIKNINPNDIASLARELLG